MGLSCDIKNYRIEIHANVDLNGWFVFQLRTKEWFHETDPEGTETGRGGPGPPAQVTFGSMGGLREEQRSVPLVT